MGPVPAPAVERMVKPEQPVDLGVIIIREDECDAILDRLDHFDVEGAPPESHWSYTTARVPNSHGGHFRIAIAVPGAPQKAENAYHICQALSWVVRERRQVQDQLDGMRQLPELMKALVSSVDAALS